MMTILALISISSFLQSVSLVGAEFLPAPAIVIISPLFVTYQNSSVPLSFGANILTDDPAIVYLRYSLDGNANITFTNLMKTGQQNFAPNKTGFTYHIGEPVMLNNLSEGNHTLRVYSQDATGKEMSGLVEFTIDTHHIIPEFPTWISIPSFIMVTLFLAVVIKSQLKPKRDSVQSLGHMS
jgi:hypothetical protein